MRYSLLRYYWCLVGLLACTYLGAQIHVINPSMEDTPSDATVPQGWSPCAFLTTPDILPGYWGVYLDPFEGDTYVGIITRENGTVESFGQRLSEPLTEGMCYEFNLQLAHSKVYAGYGQPIKIKIYIADELCGTKQVIYTSPFVAHEEWKQYDIQFTPKQTSQYIMIEAFYKEGSFSHKGNILIDALSSIHRCNRA